VLGYKLTLVDSPMVLKKKESMKCTVKLVFAVLGNELRVLHMLSKCSASELQFQPPWNLFRLVMRTLVGQ
jgi:hypothetical protein